MTDMAEIRASAACIPLAGADAFILAATAEKFQEMFLNIFCSFFWMKKCNSASKRDEFVIIPAQLPWNRAAVPEWIHGDQRHAEEGVARAGGKAPVLGGPTESERSASSPPCLEVRRKPTWSRSYACPSGSGAQLWWYPDGVSWRYCGPQTPQSRA